MPVARLYHCIAVLALFAAQICFAQAFLDTKSQDLDTIRQALEKRIRRNSVLFFYYAGHGVQIDGRNYLVPRDTRTGSLDQVAEDA